MSRKRKHLDNDSDATIEKIRREAKLVITLDDLRDVHPLTKNQELVFEQFEKKNLFLHGIAGVGKTYLALYLALREVLGDKSKYKKIYIVRSVVPTADVGFLPGTLQEKTEVYEQPYRWVCNKLLGSRIKNAYERLKEQKLIEFMTTAFIRGTEFTNSIIIFDECQNANFHELDSTLTRCDNNTKILFLGDYTQSDLKNRYDRCGFFEFLKIINTIPEWFYHIEFDQDDIIRGAMIKAYLIAKTNLGIGI